MGKLYVCLAAAMTIGACGNDHGDKLIDAPKMIDAAPDAKVYMDAAAPTYDFSCATNTLPTTAANPISIAGTTETISTGGLTSLAGVTVTPYKNGSTTPLVTAVTSNSTGAYTLAGVPTGGVPLAGFLEADVAGGSATYRTTFVYPPYPLAASTTAAQVIMVSTAAFTQLETFAGTTQDDTKNGAIFALVTDCASKPIQGATLNVTQGGAPVTGAKVFDVGSLDAAAAGIFIVLNVPAGSTDLTATYTTYTLPATGTFTVVAYKNHQMGVTNGSLTTTIVRPGPAN